MSERKQKQNEQQDKHKDKVQEGVPKHIEKGRQDENKEKGTTKNHKDKKQGDAADKRNENGHKPNIQPKRNLLQSLNINTLLLAVCICVIAVLAAYVWRVDEHYKTEVANLQEKIIMMEEMITSNTDKLTNHDEEIQVLRGNVNNAATKQDMNSKITQLDTKIKTKCKG